MRLFIYIPTYNRPDALRKQLGNLVPQIRKRENTVRVLVNDNASPNLDFEKLALEFCGSNITFRQNPGNIDGNANIALGFTFAKPYEFLWILSDNDFLTENSLDFVLEKLDEKFDLIHFAWNDQRAYDADFRWVDGPFEHLDNGSGLISLIIYNMKTVSTHIKNAFYFHNSSFPHLAVILAMQKGQGQIRFRVLPKDNVFNLDISDKSHGGDYSLAYTGFPQIIPLLNPVAARKFCSGWLLDVGFHFCHKRHLRYPNYLHTKTIMLAYGGKWIRIKLFLNWLRYPIQLPLVTFRAFVKTKHPRTFNHLKRIKIVAMNQLARAQNKLILL